MCKTSTKVFILEVMGRHAGWIAASAELANSSEDTFVHKILLPEVQLDKDAFLDGIQNDVKNYGYSVVVASEGLKTMMATYMPQVTQRILLVILNWEG